jgi:hypothetical protein
VWSTVVLCCIVGLSVLYGPSLRAHSVGSIVGELALFAAGAPIGGMADARSYVLQDLAISVSMRRQDAIVGLRFLDSH